MAFLTVGRVTGVASRRDELVAALLDLQSAARQEAGCVAYVAGGWLEDRDTFTVQGHFADAAALDAHYASAGFAEYQGRLDGLLAQPSTLEVFEVVSTARPVSSGPMDPRQAD